MTAPKSERDGLFASWVERHDKILKELRDAHFHQALWTAFRDEVQARHPTADATFLVSYSMVYIDAQAMLIRRLADLDDETHSLASLIVALQRNPEVMTRTRYMKLFGEHGEREGWDVGSDWDRQFAAPGDSEHVNPALLADDLARLADETKVITTWATKVLAHLDPHKPLIVPKYGEIRLALAIAGEIANHYESMFRRSEHHWGDPWFEGDWQAMFRPALFALSNDVYAWPQPGGYT